MYIYTVKQFYTILLLSFSTILIGQNTAIPDANFESTLIILGYDTIQDGQVTTSNISGITRLIIPGNGISDLTGIEDFTSLITLDCSMNELTLLGLTQNTSLDSLICYSNEIASLDLTQNASLTQLNCEDNLLSYLDVTMNPALTTLICSNNQLSTLDLNQNSSLILLRCDTNQLSCLKMGNGNNSNVVIFNAYSNPFSCVQVDSVAYSIANWTNIDNSSVYNEICSICGFSGIDELPSSFVTIYPNPTTGLLSLSLEEGTTTSITIRNSLGQILLYDRSLSEGQLELDISTYATGVYFLQLEVGDQVVARKIMKQ